MKTSCTKLASNSCGPAGRRCDQNAHQYTAEQCEVRDLLVPLATKSNLLDPDSDKPALLGGEEKEISENSRCSHTPESPTFGGPLRLELGLAPATESEQKQINSQVERSGDGSQSLTTLSQPPVHEPEMSTSIKTLQGNDHLAGPVRTTRGLSEVPESKQVIHKASRLQDKTSSRRHTSSSRHFPTTAEAASWASSRIQKPAKRYPLTADAFSLFNTKGPSRHDFAADVVSQFTAEIKRLFGDTPAVNDAITQGSWEVLEASFRSPPSPHALTDPTVPPVDEQALMNASCLTDPLMSSVNEQMWMNDSDVLLTEPEEQAQLNAWLWAGPTIPSEGEQAWMNNASDGLPNGTEQQETPDLNANFPTAYGGSSTLRNPSPQVGDAGIDFQWNNFLSKPNEPMDWNLNPTLIQSPTSIPNPPPIQNVIDFSAFRQIPDHAQDPMFPNSSLPPPAQEPSIEQHYYRKTYTYIKPNANHDCWHHRDTSYHCQICRQNLVIWPNASAIKSLCEFPPDDALDRSMMMVDGIRRVKCVPKVSAPDACMYCAGNLGFWWIDDAQVTCDESFNGAS